MDRERIEREAAIILRNLRHGLTEERTAKSITALVLRERAAVWEKAAEALDEHGRDRQPQYGDRYMQEVSLYGRQGGSHPATVRFSARWLASACRALAAQERDQ